MGERVGYILAFLAGGLVGVAIGYRIAYNNAEERADIEIEEMRAYFNAKQDLTKGRNAAIAEQGHSVEDAAEKSRRSQNKPSVVELANVKEAPEVKKVNYTSYSEETPADVVVTDEPVIISQDEYGDIAHYSRVNLTYYDDKILADDLSMRTFKKDEVERAIGLKALDQFNKLDPSGRSIDQIWVRNDRTKTYYSIVTDDREYAVAAGWEGDDL